MALNRNPPVIREIPFVRTDRIGFVRLYIEDLDNLLRVLRDGSANVLLMAGSATAASASDLIEATDSELATVRIITDGPRVDITLGAAEAKIVSTNEDQATQLLHSQALGHPSRASWWGSRGDRAAAPLSASNVHDLRGRGWDPRVLAGGRPLDLAYGLPCRRRRVFHRQRGVHRNLTDSCRRRADIAALSV